MYIKRVTKSNKSSKRKYIYLHLVENIRTAKGPRQRLILNLGNLNFKPEKYKELANCIESMLSGQTALFSNDLAIQKEARRAVRKINFKKSKELPENIAVPDIRAIDITSIDAYNIRTIGPEYLCHSIWQKLKITDCLLSAHVSPHVIPLLETLVIGRSVSPGSERHTKKWAEKNSAVYELTGEPLRSSLNSFYRGTDILLECKEKLENHLSCSEKGLFSLDERIFFFDLTNTHFEGEMEKNPKADFGRSKQKRSDCRLVTLALVIDYDGFIKYSKLYPGNQYEAHTLSEMIENLKQEQRIVGDNPTIVMDAGIAHKENIEYLQKEKFHYIVVNKGQSPFTQDDLSDMVPITSSNSGDVGVTIKRNVDEQTDEVYILCKSSNREKKESSIRNRQEKLFIEQINQTKVGLNKKGCVKNYSKIVEKIGRLKEKYSKASARYKVTVIAPENDINNLSKVKAVDILWEKKKPLTDAKNFDGCYVLRTNRIDLEDEEIWHIYTMLTRIEKAFKDMKSYLGLRPNFHQLENRGDAHIFISVLAYHIIHAIEYRLNQIGDTRNWQTIRETLTTHCRLTIECTEYNSKNKTKGKNFLRICSRPEPEHEEIYKSLGLNFQPLKKRYYENL